MSENINLSYSLLNNIVGLVVWLQSDRDNVFSQTVVKPLITSQFKVLQTLINDTDVYENESCDAHTECGIDN